MNALFNYLSSPLKKQTESPAPPPSSMPLTASPRKSFSPREQRLARRASEGRSPRSRLSNVSAATSAHDNTADVSIVSHRRQTSTTMLPPNTKRQSTSRQSTSARSSPIRKRQSIASTARVASSPRVAPSPRVRSSPRRQPSVELGSPGIVANSPGASQSPIISLGSVAKKSRFQAVQTGRRSSGAFVSPTEVNGKPRKQKSPEVEEPEEQQPTKDDGEQKYEFQRILGYRWNDDKIQLEVQWKDGDKTWTEEEIFHADNKAALLAFWRTFKNGRPQNPDQGDVYHVFAIRKHRVRKGEPEVLVEWVGYDNSERTWESQSYIEEVAKAHVDAYFDKVYGKTKPLGKAKVNGKAKAQPKAKAPARTSTRTQTRGSSRVTKR
ncbi:Chromo domain-containing protein T09A5.8 [Fusarium austroafricanum]|uniref:Chromo domain-containing protein T09A5.8 n=1 Tax=Fusarium austroafricanum TaxID=2364996 RepID=A0A8H4NWE8_9HYPO|nr:Chromo domain-containing protein T09A5.8 [Fusarium austroafricanum]